jgi:hypothetical protein
MQRLSLAAITMVLLGGAALRAEPVRVSFEVIELDCTKCREAHEQYASACNAAASESARWKKDGEAFKALEKVAKRRSLVHHVEWIEPGTKGKRTTRCADATFAFELLLTATQDGQYLADFDMSLTRPDEGRIVVATTMKLAPGPRTIVAAFTARDTTRDPVDVRVIAMVLAVAQARVETAHATPCPATAVVRHCGARLTRRSWPARKG